MGQMGQMGQMGHMGGLGVGGLGVGGSPQFSHPHAMQSVMRHPSPVGNQQQFMNMGGVPGL